MNFDPKNYWEKRLSTNYTLTGVGDIRLPETYNRFLYAVRSSAFDRVVQKSRIVPAATDVLDIGSGTGFYIDNWLAAGARSVTGSDLTSVAVDNLSSRYPTCQFEQWDVGSEKSPFSDRTFDAVSAFDILFHIVDDKRYTRALSNIFSLVKPGGRFICSDNFMRGSERRSEHFAFRRREFILNAAESTGFQLVATVPMFFIMNAPVAADNRILNKLYNLILRTASRGPMWGKLTGAALLPFELLMIKLIKKGPGTEIAIFEKPQ